MITAEWKPRWYYVMQNRTSGTLYVGQSSLANMDAYCGSGQYWVPHCKKHGGYNRANIEIIEQSWFENKADAELWLKMLSDDCPEYWKSDKYANQMPEDSNNVTLITPEIQKKAVEKANESHRKNGTGFFNKELQKQISSRGIETQRRNKLGFFGVSKEQRRANGLKAVETHRRNGTGFFDPEVGKKGSQAVKPETRSRIGILGGKATGKVRIKCVECGMITTPGCLARHQKASGHSGKERIK